jgi:hypothetical protein
MRRVAVAAVLAALGAVPWLVWWSALPDPVATHWSAGGRPNGHLAPAVAFAVLAGISVAAAVGVAASGRLPGASVGLSFVAGTVSVASLSTVLANRDAASWRDAHLTLWWVAAAVGLGLLAAVVLAPRRTTAAASVPPVGPAVPVGAHERVSWVGGARGRVLVWTAVAAAVFGVALFPVQPVAAVILLLTAALMYEFGVVRVVVGGHGVRVVAALGWPRMTVDLDRIAAARSVDVRPMKWGGWGYRGSLRLAKRAAWVVRAGDGLQLDLAGGRLFVVTVDDAERAAAVVNGLRAAATRT